ncbi:flavin-containing monooxygenase [Trujillonella endophytica]|uniref:Predicted flavoprotein CzcO associated with the cation diffusion facilitator CzcD n=1 Tax=Trujillonella endophytica TaxID=673521 RepID=A0A1H8Q737_9ACTN|nr:NAD(P)/FAD-dependent oxidoreductase [Trujillella endophytica]SEO49583.1 Predicted flavoprotein CzcO associated with the cation diffusion facilitator CzcD [Trujillella endophytica]
MSNASTHVDVDAVVVGAGFAGLYAIHRLRGDGLSVRGFDGATDVGGTWYWNRYPGARCDVESLDYSFSFSPELEQEWNWTERYASQPEILRYLQFVADRLDLRRDITFGTRVDAAAFDEDSVTWTVRTSSGEEVRARFLLLATGPLSVANVPSLPGQETFAGRTFHTGGWPHEPVDFTGRRVAVIGTGSSGIQVAPRIAEQADHLYVLQRTPNYTIPAHNFTWEPDALAEAKAGYRERRARAWQNAGGSPNPAPTQGTFDVDEAERRRIFEERWAVGGARWLRTFTDTTSDHAANAEAVAFVHEKIRERVRDPEVAAKLSPTTYPIGARRVCVDTGYWDTFNRGDVTLVDVREDPIEGLEPAGLRLRSGRVVEIDDLVFATGFDAMTGAVTRLDIRGRDGRQLRDEWAEGPRTALGIAVAGFPNLFLLNGPGSPSVLANMVLTSEQQVNWVADALGYVRSHGLAALEAEPAAQDAWTEHCNSLAEHSMMFEADSWYIGANIPGKPRVLMFYLGGLPAYMRACDEVAADDYRGFVKVPADEVESAAS